MKNTRITTLIFAALTMAAALIATSAGYCQEINKDVIVVRPYEPSLSDASRYSFMPGPPETKIEHPDFKYRVVPKPLENIFVPEAIKPAKTTTTSLPRIYKSWIKLGIGNYSTPLAEFNISNLQSKEFSAGLYLFHKSSRSQLSLANDDKVPSGYVVNHAEVYGKQFMKNATLSGTLRFKHHGYHYYGYNTAYFADSLPDIQKNDIRQNQYRIGADVSIRSTANDSDELAYSVNLGYLYAADKLKNHENNLDIAFLLRKGFNGLLVSTGVEIRHSTLTALPDSLRNTTVTLSPSIGKANSSWRFLLGLDAVVDAAALTNFYIYPKALLDIIIIEEVLIPFAGIRGELKRNNWASVSEENPFVIPGLRLENESHPLIVFGGIKGSISDKVSFRADVSYRAIKNKHFFVSDTLSELRNYYQAAYDDIDLITYHGELAFQPSPRLQIDLEGSYYQYEMFALDKPWHMPEYTVNAGATCDFGKKITLKLDASVTGTRFAYNPYVPEGPEKLKPVADLNLLLNYNYSKVFSVFASFHNLAERSYLLWNQYPSQRFNFLAGITYKL